MRSEKPLRYPKSKSGYLHIRNRAPIFVGRLKDPNGTQQGNGSPPRSETAPLQGYLDTQRKTPSLRSGRVSLTGEGTDPKI